MEDDTKREIESARMSLLSAEAVGAPSVVVQTKTLMALISTIDGLIASGSIRRVWGCGGGDGATGTPPPSPR